MEAGGARHLEWRQREINCRPANKIAKPHTKRERKRRAKQKKKENAITALFREVTVVVCWHALL